MHVYVWWVKPTVTYVRICKLKDFLLVEGRLWDILVCASCNPAVYAIADLLYVLLICYMYCCCKAPLDMKVN